MWERLNVGYIQGMCDLCAPLLVIIDDGKYHESSKQVNVYLLKSAVKTLEKGVKYSQS